MSAPNGGRQSPDPENQAGKQQQAPPAEKPNDQGQAASNDQPANSSKDTLKGLESNPTHPLQKHAEEKTAKTT